MKIKVGEEIKIGAKKRMIVEIQTDAFDWKQNQICFDDKTRMTQLELVEAFNDVRVTEQEWRDMALKEAMTAITIPKKDLVAGAIYKGHCRNARYALWNDGKFEYIREKFGNEFIESIVHPEDDAGYDVFVPVVKTEYKLLTDCPL